MDSSLREEAEIVRVRNNGMRVGAATPAFSISRKALIEAAAQARVIRDNKRERQLLMRRRNDGGGIRKDATNSGRPTS
jgi:hypothetical protein